jgi:hypothetical protein
MRHPLLVIFAYIGLASFAQSQIFRGGISGSVADITGAIVAEAVVRATNSATGLLYSTVSSSAGGFSLQDLPVGEYTMEVSKPGFQNLRVNAVRVSAGQVYNLPLKLNVAQQATTVEVSAAKSVHSGIGHSGHR